MLVKPLSEETTLASATDVDNASVVRLVNTGAATTVTIKDGATTVASLTLTQGEVIHLQKSPTQTLSAVAAVKAVKVAHTN
jgi:hypothetical protein